MAHTSINPDGVLEIPGLSQVIVSTGTRHVHVSGQTPTGPDGALLHAGDLQQQIVVTLRNLVTCLDAVGATVDDVVNMKIYIVEFDPSCLDALFGALSEVFGDDLPAPTSTLIGVQALFMPGQRIEIDAVAVLD